MIMVLMMKNGLMMIITYYGANTAESWMSRWNPKTNTDWHASTKSSQNTHSTQFNAGDLFGNTIYTGDGRPLSIVGSQQLPNNVAFSN